MQKLSYEHFFDIFAKNKVQLLKAKYESDIRPLLTARSRQFWDSHIKRCCPCPSIHPSRRAVPRYHSAILRTRFLS